MTPILTIICCLFHLIHLILLLSMQIIHFYFNMLRFRVKNLSQISVQTRLSIWPDISINMGKKNSMLAWPTLMLRLKILRGLMSNKCLLQNELPLFPALAQIHNQPCKAEKLVIMH
jgi:hypothetical protein